jgi:osmoprotectant transport system permease protein
LKAQSAASIVPQGQPDRWNPVSAVLSLLACGALLGFPFLRVAPNRMLSGEPVFLVQALQGWAWLLTPLLLCVLALPLVRPNRAVLWLQMCMACALTAALLGLAAWHARQWALGQSPLARVSLGAAFWVTLVVCWLMAADALQRLRVGLVARIGMLGAVALPMGAMLALGWCDGLSIMKEYANRSDLFAAALARHLQIVLLALVPTLFIGVPLGWWAHKKQAARQALFPALNVIQTIPSIALFGLLMAPLALLATAFPALAQAGISGVGLAPGVIALALYSLLPVVRGTVAGLEQVPSGVVDAARGMGMSLTQIFLHAEFPLALPVLLAGVRTAAVQAVGLAAVTALIGAGGLGAIMFEGLFSSAQDLVLLGVAPIVALAVLTDAAFKVLIRLSQSPHLSLQA